MKNIINLQVEIKVDFCELLNDYRIEIDKRLDVNYEIDKSIWLLLNRIDYIFPKGETTILPNGIVKLIEIYPYKTFIDSTVSTVILLLISKSKLFWKLIYELQYKQAPLKECSLCGNYWFNRETGGCKIKQGRSINPSGSIVRKDDHCIDFKK